MPDNSTLNIYVNSGGGSVTATQGIIGILNKAKREKGIKRKREKGKLAHELHKVDIMLCMIYICGIGF